MLLASATSLPLLLAAAGCRSSEVFAGPDPLAGRPRLSPDVITLQAVIAAEQDLINLYLAAIYRGSGSASQDLKSLLAQHEQHLTRLQARLVLPSSASPAARASAGAPAGPSASTAPARVTVARLRAAEHASATALVQRLATVEPALAQLFASIAACDATHVTVLGG
jgi:hypothetical protein